MRALFLISIIAGLPLQAGSLNASHNTPQKDWHIRWHNRDRTDKDYCSDAQALKVAGAIDAPVGMFAGTNDPDGATHALEALEFREPNVSGNDVRIKWVLGSLTAAQIQSDGLLYSPANYTPNRIVVNSAYIDNLMSDADILSAVTHEVFHGTQYAYCDWRDRIALGELVREGQARMMEDKLFNRLDEQYLAYAQSVDCYRGSHKNLRSYSYGGALWWSYLAEQFGPDRVEPHFGVRFIRKFWQFASNNEPSAYDILQRTLDAFDRQTTFAIDQGQYTVEEIFHDFSIANYTTIRSSVSTTRAIGVQVESPDRFQHVDCALSAVKPRDIPVTRGTPTDGTPFSGASESLRWASVYFEADLSWASGVDLLGFQGQCHDGNTASFALLAYKADDSVERIWNSGLGLSAESTFSVALMQDGSAPFTKLVAVVTGWDGGPASTTNGGTDLTVDFDYCFAVGGATVNILEPIDRYPAFVGEHDAPERFLVRLWVTGPPELGEASVEGLKAEDFAVYVGAQAPENQATVHIASYVQGEYWLTCEAPAKLVDNPAPYPLSVVLGNATDIEPDSVIYEEVELDQMIVIDHSGSMASSDKIAAAKAAATLYVDVSGTSDQIGLVSFNGNDIEVDQDATLNLNLAAMDSDVERALVASGIALITPSGWTSIGDGLAEAKEEFLRHGAGGEDWIILLSDGKENEDLLYADVLPDLQAEGIRVMAIALGPDSDQALMQQIATDTTGRYIYVDAPADGSRSAGDFGLALADAYVSSMEEMRRLQRIWDHEGPLSTGNTEQHRIQINTAMRNGVFSFNWLNESAAISASITRPDGSTVKASDAGVEIFASGNRGSSIHIADIDIGEWIIDIAAADSTNYFAALSAKDREGPNLGLYFTQFHGDTGAKANYGLYLHGLPMPIMATLTDSNGPILGASVTANITHADGRPFTLTLYDDGSHNDGFAKDGIYANTFAATTGHSPNGGDDKVSNPARGSYPVTVLAQGTDNAGFGFSRRRKGAFQIWDNPQGGSDIDNDGMPGRYEARHDCLNPTLDDAHMDADLDGLHNLAEFRNGTDPCNADTDGGGETDGSELARGADPLDPDDDAVRKPLDAQVVKHIEEDSLLQLLKPNANLIRYGANPEYQTIHLHRATDEAGPYSLVASFDSKEARGLYEDRFLTNGTTYYYFIQAEDADGNSSAGSHIFSGTPRIDPYPPQGYLAIAGPVDLIDTHDTKLLLSASEDTVEMRISENADFAGAIWRSYSDRVDWTLSEGDGIKRVFLQLRDPAGNESRTIADSVELKTDVALGTLSGSVEVDSSGLPARSAHSAAGIHVQATSADASIHTFTDENGDYTLNFLPAGDYTLTFTRRGFQPMTLSDISLGIGQQFTPPLAQIAARQSTLALTPAPAVSQAVVATEGQASTFRVLAEGTTPYTYSWFVNEEQVENDGPIFAYTPSHDSIAHPADSANLVVEVVVDDADGDQEFAQWSNVTLRNSDQVSVIESAAPSPAQPVTTDDISIIATGSDPDGDAVSFRVSWEILDAGRAAIEGPILSAANTAAGYRIRATIWPVTNPYGRYETLGEPATLEFEIANSAPIANDAALGTPLNTDLAVFPAAYDPDGDPISFAIGTPAHGSVIDPDPANGRFTYRPDVGFSGADSFSITVSDGESTGVGTIVITVDPSAGPPLAVDDSFTGPEDSPLSGSVLANDIAADGPFPIVTAYTQPTSGSVSVTATGSFSYVPGPDFFGPDHFSYTIITRSLARVSARVDLAITNIDDLPITVADSATTDEDTPFVFDLLANDEDIDSPLTLVSWTSPNFDGTTYTPIPDFHGEETFVYEVNDGVTGVATVVVRAINDLPVNTALPVISGIAAIGETVIVTPGSWNDDDDIKPGTIALSYQWLRDGADIPGAIGSSYALVDDDLESALTVRESATNVGEGTPATVTASVESAPRAAGWRVRIGTPARAGSVTFGMTSGAAFGTDPFDSATGTPPLSLHNGGVPLAADWRPLADSATWLLRCDSFSELVLNWTASASPADRYLSIYEVRGELDLEPTGATATRIDASGTFVIPPGPRWFLIRYSSSLSSIYTFRIGYNLISFPYQPDGNAREIFIQDGVAQDLGDLTYVMGGQDHLAGQVEAYRGYWLFTPRREIVRVEGIPAPRTLSIAPGYNSIGTDVEIQPSWTLRSRIHFWSYGYRKTLRLTPQRGYLADFADSELTW